MTIDKISYDNILNFKTLKGDVKYTEYPGVSHNSRDNAFAEPEFLNWMFSHKR